MKLLDLPVELFVSVIHEFVSYVGVDKAWKARMVCRAFAHLIDADVFSNQPLQAFALTTDGGLFSSSSYSTVLTHNMGRFIFARTQDPLDVTPLVPSTINRCLDFLMTFEDDEATHIARRSQLAQKLSNAATANPQILDLLSDNTFTEERNMTVASTPEESDLMDRLAASVATSNQMAVLRCLQDGATLSEENIVFGDPLVVSVLYSVDVHMTAFLLNNIQMPSEREVWDWNSTLIKVVEELVYHKRLDGVVKLLDWIIEHGELDTLSFDRLLSTAIVTQDRPIVEAVLKIEVKSSPKASWEHFSTAVRHRPAHLLDILVEKGAFKINQWYHNTRSPLNEAILLDRVEHMRKLLELGAHPDGPPERRISNRLCADMPPLWSAVKSKRLDLVNVLLENGATLASCVRYSSEATLFATAGRGQESEKIKQRLRRALKEERKVTSGATIKQ